MNKDLQLVVGIEMHCELKSHAKAFSKGINGFSDTANVYVSPVDMAFRGLYQLLIRNVLPMRLRWLIF